MEENVKWEGTIVDGTKWEEGFSMESKTPVFYFVSIAMYVISFFYLFGKSLPATYMIYVFVFILSTVFPFIWMEDFLRIVSTSANGQSLVLYRKYGVIISLTIQFLGLFLVVLSNENIRKMKLYSVPKDQETNNREKVRDMTTNDAETRLTYKNIAILFVTITTLLWGVVGEAFSENKIIKLSADNSSALIQTIRWLLNQPYQMIYNFDTLWNNFMQKIQVSPLVKASGMFCATFLVLFFGAFVRIKHFKHPLAHHITDTFNIVNIGPMFPPFFKRHPDIFRDLSVFFLSLITSLCFGGIVFYLKSCFKEWIPKPAVIMSTLAGFALFFGCFFGKRKEMFPDIFSIKKLIYFLLCIVFTMVGTPVVLGVLQLIVESGILDGVMRFCLNILNSLTKGNASYPMLETLNTNGLLGGSAFVISITLLFTMFGLGLDKKWVVDSNGKSMQMFLATLITMSVAMFAALNTRYKVCTALYTFIKSIVELVIVFLAPATMVALSIVLFVFSYKNYMKYKQYEKVQAKAEIS